VRDFATYYFNSIEQYASPEVFSEEKSDFYETLHSDNWPLKFLPTVIERIGRSLDACNSDYRVGLEWFQTGIPTKTKFEIIKKMTTLLFQDYPIEKTCRYRQCFSDNARYNFRSNIFSSWRYC
jgi:hypothetical protein